jgi:hypothetical protein
MTKLALKNKQSTKDRAVTTLVRDRNTIVDRLLRISPEKTLNPQPWLNSPTNPSQTLLKAARALQAEVIDPQSRLVDYQRMAKSNAYRRLQEVAQSLPHYRLEDTGDRFDRIAFWINVYNALILHAVVHFGIQESMLKDLGIFRRAAYTVTGMRFSADDIEHGVLRGNRRHPYLPFPQFAPDDPRLAAVVDPPDPRIHFALVCGATSCPPIEFYEGGLLDAQLDLAASAFINGGGIRFEPPSNTLWLSQIFRWYQDDFGGLAGVRDVIQRYLADPESKTLLQAETANIRYMPYDWTVNAETK